MFRFILKTVLVMFGLMLAIAAGGILLLSGSIINFDAVHTLSDWMAVLRFLGVTGGLFLLGLAGLKIGILWTRRDMRYRYRTHRFFEEYDHYRRYR